jgi:hypothetical protein
LTAAHAVRTRTSIVSLLYVLEDGASAEIAITGNEGLVGISLFMGGESTPSRAVVQTAGNGYRLKASILKREFALGGDLQHLALRFTQALITQMAQTAVCNRHHALDQQLRWTSNYAVGCSRYTIVHAQLGLPVLRIYRYSEFLSNKSRVLRV